MKKVPIIGAAMALAIAAPAHAVADCWKDMKQGGDHAG